MPAPTVIEPRAGEVVGDARDRRVEILAGHDALNATWSRFGPGRDGADLHVHHEHVDLFYVLDGDFTLRLGPEGDEVVVPAGTLACMPPGVVHGFRNGSDAEIRYLNLHAPGRRFADFLRALRDGREFGYDQFDPPADGGRPVADALIGPREEIRAGVTLLVDVDEIAVAEIDGVPADPPHVHARHTESLYVLVGELAVTSGTGELRAPPGAWVEIPPGAPHAVTGTARYLELHTPSTGFGAHLRGAGGGFDLTPLS